MCAPSSPMTKIVNRVDSWSSEEGNLCHCSPKNLTGYCILFCGCLLLSTVSLVATINKKIDLIFVAAIQRWGSGKPPIKFQTFPWRRPQIPETMINVNFKLIKINCSWKRSRNPLVRVGVRAQAVCTTLCKLQHKSFHVVFAARYDIPGRFTRKLNFWVICFKHTFKHTT